MRLPRPRPAAPKVDAPPVEPPKAAPRKSLKRAAPALVVPNRLQALDQKGQVIGGAVNGALAAPVPAAVVGAPLYTGPLVRYSLLRSGPSGDAVRIEVVSQLAGNLALYQADAAGQWQRVFPVNAPGLPIMADIAYQVPDDPLAIGGNQNKLRLVIEPSAGPAFRSQFAAGSLDQPRAKALTERGRARAASGRDPDRTELRRHLQSFQQNENAAGRFRVSSETKFVVSARQIFHQQRKLRLLHHARELARGEPGRLFNSTPPQGLQHSLVEQRRVGGLGASALDFQHALPGRPPSPSIAAEKLRHQQKHEQTESGKPEAARKILHADLPICAAHIRGFSDQFRPRCRPDSPTRDASWSCRSRL